MDTYSSQWQSQSTYSGHSGHGPCGTPERLSLWIIETVQKRFLPRAALEIFLSSHTWTHLVTHLVHIGTHRGLGRVLTGRAHRVY